MFKVSISIHLIAIIMWIGSMLISSRIAALEIKATPENLDLRWQKKIVFGWTMSGMFIALLTGLYQLASKGMEYYMVQAWFTTKLTLVFVLVATTVFYLIKIKSNSQTLGSMMAIHGVTALCFFVIVFLTILGR